MDQPVQSSVSVKMVLHVTTSMVHVTALQAGKGLTVPFLVQLERLVLTVLNFVRVRMVLHVTMLMGTAHARQATLESIVHRNVQLARLA